MSLRSYLFALIGGLIALLTVIQLSIVFWIEANLAQEVDKKARHYSKQIVELAVERLDANQESIKKIIEKEKKLKKEHHGNNENVMVYNVESDHVISITKDKNGEITNEVIIGAKGLEEANQQVQISKKLLKKEFKTIVDKLHQEQSSPKFINKNDMQTFVVKSPNLVSHTWVEEQSNAHSRSLFTKIQLMLIGVAAVGLLFAFWLSGKFNRPLKELSLGFERLAKGEPNPTVKEQGIKEIRTTIEQFNHMVSRLTQLTQAQKQTKEMAHLAELGEVSRGLAHALRNPIHTIGLSIEQLQQDQEMEQLQKEELLTTVQNKLSHLDKNIKALLTLTTSGISREEKVPILAVVQDILLEYKSSMTKAINFEISIPNDLFITGAESEIRSIIHTIIHNACEASNAGDSVTLKVEHNNDQIILTSVDQGSGLVPHIEQSLFQPHISSKPEGAGMGLYIAKRLITLHYQGDLSLINNSGSGCTATATFKA